jgi:hypothetical protein
VLECIIPQGAKAIAFYFVPPSLPQNLFLGVYYKYWRGLVVLVRQKADRQARYRFKRERGKKGHAPSLSHKQVDARKRLGFGREGVCPFLIVVRRTVMMLRMERYFSVFLILLFVSFFITQEVGYAADPQIEVLYQERAETVKAIAGLREKVQNNVDLLRRHGEYLLYQGSVNFAEDEKTLGVLNQRLDQIETELLTLLRQDNLPFPERAIRGESPLLYTGASPLAFHHPVLAEVSEKGPSSPLTGPLILFLLAGSGIAVLLYGVLQNLFPGRQEAVYPCLVTFRGTHGGLKPLRIAFSSRIGH